jgi:hypothetical protein
MNLPLFRIRINEDDDSKAEVTFIALTDKPAIMENFLAYDNTRLRFAIENEEERIVTGLAIIADLPIYRRDKERGEFYTVFFAEDIKKIAQKYFRKGYQFNFNENHNANKKLEGVYAFESWIVDRSKGKLPMQGFEDVADGSWFISLKIDNPEVWEDVKAGKFTGFSVEGFFGMERLPADTATKNEDEEDEEFLAELKKLLQSATL